MSVKDDNASSALGIVNSLQLTSNESWFPFKILPDVTQSGWSSHLLSTHSSIILTYIFFSERLTFVVHKKYDLYSKELEIL